MSKITITLTKFVMDPSHNFNYVTIFVFGTEIQFATFHPNQKAHVILSPNPVILLYFLHVHSENSLINTFNLHTDHHHHVITSHHLHASTPNWFFSFSKHIKFNAHTLQNQTTTTLATEFTGLYIKRSESGIRSDQNRISKLAPQQWSKSSQNHKSFLFPSTTATSTTYKCASLPGIEFWNELQNASPKLKLTIKVKVYSQIHKLPFMPCHATHQHVKSLYFFSIFTCHMRSQKPHTNTILSILNIISRCAILSIATCKLKPLPHQSCSV